MEGNLWILPEEPLGVLSALTQLVVVEGVPGAALLGDVIVNRNVEQASFPRNALAEHDVELGEAERWSHLVLGHFDPHPVADILDAVLDCFYTSNVEPERGVELERTATRGYLR